MEKEKAGAFEKIAKTVLPVILFLITYWMVDLNYKGGGIFIKLLATFSLYFIFKSIAFDVTEYLNNKNLPAYHVWLKGIVYLISLIVLIILLFKYFKTDLNATLDSFIYFIYDYEKSGKSAIYTRWALVALIAYNLATFLKYLSRRAKELEKI